jgi:indoleamine 2,3-dioxygenase
LNLWNWRPVGEDVDIRHPQNMKALHTITATEDESWFFVVSNAMEARARPLIDMMLSAIEAVDRNNAEFVAECLERLGEALMELAAILDRMDERCRPQVFYHKIRTVLAGSENMEHAGLPRGVFYDEGEGRGRWRKYRGGSNGQSSLLQFFDVVLGVDHGSSTFHRVSGDAQR